MVTWLDGHAWVLAFHSSLLRCVGHPWAGNAMESAGRWPHLVGEERVLVAALLVRLWRRARLALFWLTSCTCAPTYCPARLRGCESLAKPRSALSGLVRNSVDCWKEPHHVCVYGAKRRPVWPPTHGIVVTTSNNMTDPTKASQTAFVFTSNVVSLARMWVHVRFHSSRFI